MDVRFAPIWIYYPRVIWMTFWALPTGHSFRHLFVVNPAFGPADLFGCSKIRVFSLLRNLDVAQPESVFLEANDGLAKASCLSGMLSEYKRLIAKPEFGSRSKGIVLLRTSEQLRDFIVSKRKCRYLIQAFVTGDEVSVMFRRFPGEEMRLDSIVERKKFSILGDGRKTLRQLMSPLRDKKVASRLLQIHDGEEVVPHGERRLLSVFGIHSMGSTFHRVDKLPWWEHQIRQKLSSIDGLNYCRLDIIQNPESRDYWVLELNGAHAEPLVAYEEPINNQAFFDEFKNSMLSRINIGKMAEESGAHVPTWFEAIRLVIGWGLDRIRAI